jgi:hypothetical protein
MAEWKINVQDEDSEEEAVEEETEPEFREDSEQESEPLEDILQEVPSKPAFHFNRQGVSIFLEQEPIEDLEQDLKQTPTQTENKEKTKEPEQPMLYNAPQYSGSYNSGDYENMRKADTELDISGGALTTRETAIASVGQRRMDFNAWQQQNIDQVQSQSEKYQVRKPEKFKQQEDLPFQNKNEPKRFE